MFTRMVQIDYLAGTMELFIGNIPYPKGTIANDTNLTSSIYSSPFRFIVKTRCKVVRCFYRPDITGRLFIAYRSLLLVKARLGEDTAQFGLSGFCLTTIFTAPVGSFPFHHRHSCAVHANI